MPDPTTSPQAHRPGISARGVALAETAWRGVSRVCMIPGVMRSLPVMALLLFGLPVLASPSPPPDPLEMDSILAMIEARVGDAIILRQARSAGISFTLGVEEVLSLKRAGASDELIGGLMDLEPAAAGTPAGAPAGLEPAPRAGDAEEPSFRIYSEVDVEGREVIHITNLDESGRRMGKPAPETEPAPRNAYESRGRAEEPEEWEAWEGGDELSPAAGGGGAAQPPVIVNVFNPVAEAAALAESAPDYYGRRLVRGYLPYVPCSHRGHGGRHWVGVPSPPGSWSHYKLYHSEGNFGHTGLYDGGLYWRSHRGGFAPHPHGRALPVPFITAGAEQLNRMRANVRLGH